MKRELLFRKKRWLLVRRLMRFFLGAAIGGPKWEKMQNTPEKGLLALRKALNLFANIRPVSVSSALLHLSPLEPEILEGTDLIIVRELSSGIYFGVPWELTDTMAYDTARYQKEEIERITAFSL